MTRYRTIYKCIERFLPAGNEQLTQDQIKLLAYDSFPKAWEESFIVRRYTVMDSEHLVDRIQHMEHCAMKFTMNSDKNKKITRKERKTVTMVDPAVMLNIGEIRTHLIERTTIVVEADAVVVVAEVEKTAVATTATTPAITAMVEAADKIDTRSTSISLTNDTAKLPSSNQWSNQYLNHIRHPETESSKHTAWIATSTSSAMTMVVNGP